MDTPIALYRNPAAISPLKPTPLPKELHVVALQVVEAAARLSGSLHPVTAAAIAAFLRPANSYYSNLIEGHDTHPLEIARALQEQYSEDSRNRSLQLEATAHIAVHARLPELLAETGENPYTESFWRAVHRAFYAHLPDEFCWTTTAEGTRLRVLPGAFRTSEVRVGRHVAPAADSLPAFVRRLEEGYHPRYEHDRLARVVQIAAAHHRLAWLHPFLDGNGRVTRLFSDAAFRSEALRLAGESRSTQAAARALNIDPQRIYKWQKEALTPVAAAQGAELDPATAAKLRQLRATNRRQAQELEILKNHRQLPAMSAGSHRPTPNEPLPFYRGATGPLPGASAVLGVGRRGQRVLRVATGAAADNDSDNPDLGNGAGPGIWGP